MLLFSCVFLKVKNQIFFLELNYNFILLLGLISENVWPPVGPLDFILLLLLLSSLFNQPCRCLFIPVTSGFHLREKKTLCRLPTSKIVKIILQGPSCFSREVIQQPTLQRAFCLIFISGTCDFSGVRAKLCASKRKELNVPTV